MSRDELLDKLLEDFQLRMPLAETVEEEILAADDAIKKADEVVGAMEPNDPESAAQS